MFNVLGVKVGMKIGVEAMLVTQRGKVTRWKKNGNRTVHLLNQNGVPLVYLLVWLSFTIFSNFIPQDMILLLFLKYSSENETFFTLRKPLHHHDDNIQYDNIVLKEIVGFSHVVWHGAHEIRSKRLML